MRSNHVGSARPLCFLADRCCRAGPSRESEISHSLQLPNWRDLPRNSRAGLRLRSQPKAALAKIEGHYTNPSSTAKTAHNFPGCLSNSFPYSPGMPAFEAQLGESRI